jgi:hypothetical protein
MNWSGFGRKRSWPYRGDIWWTRLRNAMKNLRVADIHTEIRSENFPKSYRYFNLLGTVIVKKFSAVENQG